MSGPWKRLIILLSCACVARATQNRDINPHTPIQQSWEVLNEEGDTVWSTTAVQPPWTWWPDLTPDICKLVAGSLTWDLPDHTNLHKPPPDKQCVPSGIGSTFGCSGQFYLEPIFGLQNFMFALAKANHESFGISVEGHRTFTVLHGVARPQVELIGILPLPGT